MPFISVTRTGGCSPRHVNQGVWYAGSNAHALLLERLAGEVTYAPAGGGEDSAFRSGTMSAKDGNNRA